MVQSVGMIDFLIPVIFADSLSRLPFTSYCRWTRRARRRCPGVDFTELKLDKTGLDWTELAVKKQMRLDWLPVDVTLWRRFHWTKLDWLLLDLSHFIEFWKVNYDEVHALTRYILLQGTCSDAYTYVWWVQVVVRWYGRAPFTFSFGQSICYLV